MALFGGATEKDAGDYDVIRESDEVKIYVYCDKCPRSPSLEDDKVCMAETFDKLLEVPEATKVVFHQGRDYEYDEQQTKMLSEFAELYNKFLKDKERFGYDNFKAPGKYGKYMDSAYNKIRNDIFKLMKEDPIGSYVEIKREIRRQRIFLDKTIDINYDKFVNKYISILEYMEKEMKKTKLIVISKPYIMGYEFGNRDIYRNYLFHPRIKPDFMHTKVMTSYPSDGYEVDSYDVLGTDVTVFEFEDTVQTLYHIIPPEFKLSEEEYELLELARSILSEHEPEQSDFVDPQRMRSIFKTVGKELLLELTSYRKMSLSEEDVERMSSILVRYTVGFGLVEILLADTKMQDVNINSPYGSTPVFIVHGDYGDCITNIYPTKAESESWAGKLRMLSGRPLDESNQILDTQIELPNASVRVSSITRPLDPSGLAFSFRRHRSDPWTLPLFIHVKSINYLAAGLLSFLIDGTRTFLICGTRSSGKSSFLGGMMVEIMRRYRILTLEDTLELPTDSLRELGFNIQPMKVASSLVKSGNEMSASNGIRSTLRLGDSSLIVGEVRSKEAVALYEAMRVGAAANVVAGTIHGDSPYGIYDRLVNDIGLPKTSFKATDIIIITNPIKSADGIHKMKRVLQITEVRKHWENDPMNEGAFVDLMKYNPEKDELEPTEELLNGDSEIIKDIAGKITDFVGNWDLVWENIKMRGKIKQHLVDIAHRTNDMDILEAGFVVKANDKMHRLIEKVRRDVGKVDHDEIFFRWKEWLNYELKKRRKGGKEYYNLS
ncbi:MAG: ATPase, T2SS/T4P/T4SS family [Candidatus Woesearchaeota archaeon]